MLEVGRGPEKNLFLWEFKKQNKTKSYWQTSEELPCPFACNLDKAPNFSSLVSGVLSCCTRCHAGFSMGSWGKKIIPVEHQLCFILHCTYNEKLLKTDVDQCLSIKLKTIYTYSPLCTLWNICLMKSLAALAASRFCSHCTDDNHHPHYFHIEENTKYNGYEPRCEVIKSTIYIIPNRIYGHLLEILMLL